jgi:hypothetical protein
MMKNKLLALILKSQNWEKKQKQIMNKINLIPIIFKQSNNTWIVLANDLFLKSNMEIHLTITIVKTILTDTLKNFRLHKIRHRFKKIISH